MLESDCPSPASLEQREDDETIGVSRKESSDSPTDLELDDGGESLHDYRHPRPLEIARLRFFNQDRKETQGNENDKRNHNGNWTSVY